METFCVAALLSGVLGTPVSGVYQSIENNIQFKEEHNYVLSDKYNIPIKCQTGEKVVSEIDSKQMIMYIGER